MNLGNEFGVYPRDRARAYLEKKGCPPDSVGWAANTEIVTQGGRFVPTLDAGLPAIVLPVHDDVLVDIVAWEPGMASKWYLRKGTDSVLGWYDLRNAIVYRQPIRVHDTPFDWLMDGMRGCVPLTWDAGKHFIGVTEMHASAGMFKKIITSMAEMYPVPVLVESA